MGLGIQEFDGSNTNVQRRIEQLIRERDVFQAEAATLEEVITQQRFDNGKLVEEVERLNGRIAEFIDGENPDG